MVHYVLAAMAVVGAVALSSGVMAVTSPEQLFPCSSVPYAEFNDKLFCPSSMNSANAASVEKCACHLLQHGMMWRAKLEEKILAMMDDVNHAINEYMGSNRLETEKYKYGTPPSVHHLLNDAGKNSILVTLLTPTNGERMGQDVAKNYGTSCLPFMEEMGWLVRLMERAFSNEELLQRVISQEHNLETIYEAYAVCQLMITVNANKLLEMYSAGEIPSVSTR